MFDIHGHDDDDDGDTYHETDDDTDDDIDSTNDDTGDDIELSRVKLTCVALRCGELIYAKLR